MTLLHPTHFGIATAPRTVLPSRDSVDGSSCIIVSRTLSRIGSEMLLLRLGGWPAIMLLSPVSDATQAGQLCFRGWSVMLVRPRSCSGVAKVSANVDHAECAALWRLGYG